LIVLDATAISLLVNPAARTIIDPATGVTVDRVRERYKHLEDTVRGSRGKIGITTPSLSEALILAGPTGNEFLDRITRSQHFEILPFDMRAAIELAERARSDSLNGQKRGGASGPYQKIKVDRQILAIAHVHGATAVYSDDGDMVRIGARWNIPIIRTCEMPLPALPDQLDLPNLEQD
jgi:hypothetical protein